MSYYILPKNPNSIAIEICLENEEEPHSPYISHSLIHHCKDVKNLINRLCENEKEYLYRSIEELSKIVNPYEYIYSKVAGSKFSVSKLKPSSNAFYDFLEISQTLNIFDVYSENSISSVHFGKNNSATIECLNMLREENNDTNIGFDKIDDYEVNDVKLNNMHFLFYEFCGEKNEMIIDYVKFLQFLLIKQKNFGSCIIKISDLFYKPVLDITYLLSSLFERVYIIKPNTSSITSCEKYIVCKYFTYNRERVNIYLRSLSLFDVNLQKGDSIATSTSSKTISSLVKGTMPYHFINKIEEANIIVGQQQLESLNQIVNILKNKNKEERVEFLKKNNLQKCIYWCEKYKIPYNKFSEKTNIFLSFLKNPEEEEVEVPEKNENYFDEENRVVIKIFDNEETFD